MNYDQIQKISNYYNSFKKKYPILYMFLKENKALKKFAINCRYNISLSDTISGAFQWDTTKEGFIYWHNLYTKYNRFEIEIKNEL